jgi:hypothetical protein
MSMSNSSGSVIDPDNEQWSLVTPNVPVKHFLGVYHADVPMGQQHRLFKNGKFKEDLTPGRHTWSDLSPFVEYTISMVDTRIHTSRPVIARGTIPGKSGDPATGAPDMPPCHVEIPLQLTYQLADIDTLLQTDKPLQRLELITRDQIATQIGQLRYAEVGMWPTQLRDEIQRWLRINAAGRTGLQVLEVLIIGEPRGQNDADRLLLKQFVTAREVDIERIRNAADREKKIADARAIKEAADAVGLSAAELAMAQMEGGNQLLQAHVQLEETRLNVGNWVGPQPLVRETTPHPQQPQLPPQGGSSGYGGPAADAPRRLSPPIPEEMRQADTTTPGANTPPLTGNRDSGDIDRDHIEAECETLVSQGYRVHQIDAQMADGGGQASFGYKVTVMPSDPDTSVWKSIQFQLGTSFPGTAPVVMVSLHGGAPTPWDGPILRQWSRYIHLTDVVAEVLKSM